MDCGEAVARRMMRDAFQNKAIINPIMMRFRPIAPKPVTGAAVLGGSSDGCNNAIARTKRKYVRVRKYNRKKKTTTNTKSDDNNNSTDQLELDHSAVTNLQLLPERSNGDGIDLHLSGRSLPSNSADRTVEVRRGGRGELWVTVECVTDACMDLQLEDLGSTDEERINNLEVDTCPGFISDGSNRVEWLNAAFKRMVRQKSESSSAAENEQMGVWLITKARIPYLRRRFTCQIKMQYKWGMQMERDFKVVPCDVWRMDGGGFAWKLDLKAALTLGPPLPD